MPTYRFDLNEEYGKRLEQDADGTGLHPLSTFSVRKHFHSVGTGK